MARVKRFDFNRLIAALRLIVYALCSETVEIFVMQQTARKRGKNTFKDNPYAIKKLLF